MVKFPWQKGKVPVTPQDQLPVSSGARIMVVANQKGGVGKTTTAVQTGKNLPGRKLLVDIDPQGNASFSTGTYMLGFEQPTILDIFTSNIDVRKCIVSPKGWEGMDVLPCDIRLAALEQEAAEGERTIPLNLLKDKLSDVSEDYDYIIIDTPPSLGAWTINAFRVAHRVLVPIESSDPYSVLGFNQLMQAIHKQQLQNPSLKVLGCFRTMLQLNGDGEERTKIGNELWSSITKHYPDLVMQTSVPVSIKVKEATLDNRHISNYRSTPATQACVTLAHEIVNRWEVVTRTW